MLDLFFFPSPNGLKIAIALEECGLPYRLRHVDILRGEQFDPTFLAISPNNKIPALVDPEPSQGTGPLAIFESGAILVYLADKTGRFLPSELHARFRTLQWLFWQVGGLGPMAGQAHHFRAFAPQKVPYAIDRYTDETNRLYAVLDRQLTGHRFIAGDYSIADMAVWPWIVPHERQGQSLDDFPQVQRWFEEVRARPAVRRAYERGHEQQADATAYQFLYGQNAARVAAHRAARNSRLAAPEDTP